ncbi:MAG: hypothetical protein P8Y52_01650 [Xanthomonadales bacterium]
MLHRTLLTILALSVAPPALATFEIKDPAAEIRAEEQALANPGERSCFDLLVDSMERPQVYRAAVDWVSESLGGVQPRIATEAALRAFCIDHPKHSVAEAAAVLARAPDPSSGD